MKTVVFLRSSTPVNPELGYGDHVEVFEDKTVVFGSHASTCPNPYRLNISGFPKPWHMLYGWIAEGNYTFKCMKHSKFGKCLLVNDGGNVESCVPNPRHNGEKVLSEIFVHQGGIKSKNPNWRGSMGCLTLHINDYQNFIACFRIGEVGKLVVKRLIENKK